MDSKLYKILKQLKKLGILTNNTKVVRRRKRKTRVGNSSQQYTNAHNRPTTVITTPTVQSEQAIVNLKQSEMQLQHALQNKDLPDESKRKVQLAIEDIKNQLDQTNRTVNVNYNYLGDKIRDAKYYTAEVLDDEDGEYNEFVPQTKNPSMIPSMGMRGSSPYKPQTSREWLNMNDIDTDNELNSEFAKVHPEEQVPSKPPSPVMEDVSKPPIPVMEDVSEPPSPVMENVSKPPIPVMEDVSEPSSPVMEDVSKPTSPVKNAKQTSAAKTMAKRKALRAELAELLDLPLQDVNAGLGVKEYQSEINLIKVEKLQKRYKELGGKNRSMLGKSYTGSVKTLQDAVDKLVDKLNKKG